MTLPVDHIHNLDSYITNEGEAFEAPTDKDSVNMDLWVPSELVSFHLVEPPAAPKRKWAELIPWMLEDRLLQPIEELHFVDCGQNADGQIQVLVVSQLDLQNWQRIARNSAAVANGMYPDYLALPWEAGRISVGWRDGVCLVRYGALEGFAATPEMSWSMIELLLKEDSGLRVSLSVPSIELVPPAIVDVADINDADLDWQFSSPPSQSNLLTGNYGRAFSVDALLAWVPVSVLAVTSILLSVMYFDIANTNREQQINQLENNLKQGYSRLFKGRRPEANEVRYEAENNIASLFDQRAGLSSQPVAGIAALDKLMTGCGCQLSALSLSENSIVMQIENGSALKKRKLNVPGYRVAITQQSGGDENAIEMRITPVKTKADS
ncbi:MAG: type II secretion system protein GspL [Porticoccaceae bacterium]